MRGGKERRMRGAGDPAEVAQQLHVSRSMTERIVPDQAAIGLAAELTELALVDCLNSGLWSHLASGIEPQVAVQFVLSRRS